MFAGQGTSHVGYGNCSRHGGSTPNGEKYALTLEAKQSMIARSAPVENAQPHLVLLEELGYSAGHVRFLRDQITELDPAEIGGARSKVLLHRYDDERDRLARIAKTCSEAGVDEARIRIHDAQAALMVGAITEAARDVGIPRRYLDALAPAIRKQMALQAGDDDAAEAAETRVAELREKIAAAEQKQIERAAQRYSGLVPADELGFPERDLAVEPPSAA